MPRRVSNPSQLEELHQTGTFEVHSTDWATALRLNCRIVGFGEKALTGAGIEPMIQRSWKNSAFSPPPPTKSIDT